MGMLWAWSGSGLTAGEITRIATSTSLQGSSTITVSATGHRNGVQSSINTTTSSSGNQIARVNVGLPARQTIWFAIAKTLTVLGDGQNILSFSFGSTVHVNIRIGTAGDVQAYRDTTLLGASAAGLVSAAQYFHLTGKVTIDDSAGEVVCYLDGADTPCLELTPAALATTVDTRNGSSALINLFGFGRWGTSVPFGSGACQNCDIALWDETDVGDGFTGWMGDISATIALPTGTGTHTDWTRGGADSGTDHGQVDESTPNDDTDYLEATSIGEATTLTWPSMASLGISGRQVVGVQTLSTARKPTSGTSSLGLRVRVGSTDYDQPGVTLPVTYTVAQHFVGRNPATSALWLEAAVDAAELGPLKAA